MVENNFQIKTDVFEGPLDLLLSFIEKHKLHISDISLSKVADDYIEFVKNLEQFPIAESAQFILIASTLLLIKSKSLLPALDLTVEEKGDIEDLQNRLKKLEEIRELMVIVGKSFGSSPLYPLQERKQVAVFSPDPSMTLGNIALAIQSVLHNLPKPEKLAKIAIKKVMNLEEVIENLTKRITSSLKMSFKDFAGVGKQEKVNVIVSFLAMLELVKQGAINVTQDEHFDDIMMESDAVNIPSYQ